MAPVPQSARFGVIVSELTSGAERTVSTAAVLVGAICALGLSCTVIVTSVSSDKVPGTTTIVSPATVCATGTRPEFEEYARYGGVPPVTVSAMGTPE